MKALSGPSDLMQSCKITYICYLGLQEGSGECRKGADGTRNQTEGGRAGTRM